MRLAVMLGFGAVLLTGCGHKNYDDFMNNSTADQWGTMMCVLAVASFVVFLALNRRREPSPDECRHSIEPAMCFRARCYNGVLNLFEVTAIGVFILSLGAGLAWATDPEGWLDTTTPLIDRVAAFPR